MAFDKLSPAQGHQALTDIDTIRANILELRKFEASAEASPPSNPDPGMFWWTTDTTKMYQRNQANTQWLYRWSEDDPPAKDSDLTTHKNSNITAAVTVHGIRQGAGNGFDADKLDGQHSSAFAAAGHVHTGFLTGLDSDKLDGQHGSYYRARANHTGTQAISTLSDHNQANHNSLGITPGSSTVGQGQLKTSTGSGNGTIIAGARVTIILADFSFFPNFAAGDLYNPQSIVMTPYWGTAAGGIGKFQIYNSSGSTDHPYSFTYRFITASEGPKYAIFYKDGVAVMKYSFEDAPPEWEQVFQTAAELNGWTYELVTEDEYNAVNFQGE
jgi:hypothetical protein